MATYNVCRFVEHVKVDEESKCSIDATHKDGVTDLDPGIHY